MTEIIEEVNNFSKIVFKGLTGAVLIGAIAAASIGLSKISCSPNQDNPIPTTQPSSDVYQATTRPSVYESPVYALRD